VLLTCIVSSAFAAWPEGALGAPDLGDGKPATARAVALQGWRVSVSVRPASRWPLAVSVGPIRPVRPNALGAWFEHDVVFANGGDRPVQFADIGFSGFLPPRRPTLAAGDQRCVPERSSLGISCLLYIDPLKVAPHSSESRTILLFKDLRGLRPLAAGTYVLETPVRFEIGRRLPEEGSGRSAVLRIAYEVEAPKR
jgi:hypothetical protein